MATDHHDMDRVAEADLHTQCCRRRRSVEVHHHHCRTMQRVAWRGRHRWKKNGHCEHHTWRGKGQNVVLELIHYFVLFCDLRDDGSQCMGLCTHRVESPKEGAKTYVE